MMLPTEIIYDDLPVLNQAKSGSSLRSWSAIATGRIREMHLWSGTVTFTKKTFNVRQNGVRLFSGSDRFALTSSDQYDSKTGLDIAVNFGDTFSFDIGQFGQGLVVTPIVFLMVTEES